MSSDFLSLEKSLENENKDIIKKTETIVDKMKEELHKKT
jgi:hypothetical protein